MAGEKANPPTGGGRIDARQNRERIVQVARTLFDGTEVTTMQSVAKRAGVGQGTLYRHFPTREDLLIAAYRDEFGSLLSSAPALVAQEGPANALRVWLDEMARLGRMKHALADVLDAAARAELHDAQLALVLDVIEDLLNQAKEAGVVRDDIHADELLALISFLWHVPLQETKTQHLLDVIVAGLRPINSTTAGPTARTRPDA